MRKTQQGFTIIELIVVIGILGLLAGVAVVTVNQSRAKGKNSNVKSYMTQIRNLAEIAYDNRGNYDDVCTESGGAAGESALTESGDWERIEASVAVVAGRDPTCNEGVAATSYVVWVQLPMYEGTRTVYCVDSLQNAKSTTTPAADATVCP